MTPSNEYFLRCDAGTPGAQRVGFDWFAWTNHDALSRALQDGMFERADTGLAEFKMEELKKELEEEQA